jgi:hypothetical protein
MFVHRFNDAQTLYKHNSIIQSREAMHKHYTNTIVLYNLGKRCTNIIQAQLYYTISGNNAQTLYKHDSIIRSQETMHKHYTNKIVL